MLARVLAGARGDLGGEQREDEPILVGGPHRSIPAQEARAGALFAAEADRAVEQARREPLESRPAPRAADVRLPQRRGRSWLLETERLADRRARRSSPGDALSR